MPSRPPAVDIASLLRRLPLALLAALVLWLLARPAYDPLVTATAEALARALESPAVATVSLEDGSALIGRTDLRSGSGRLKLSLVQIHFNLVPFLALVLALRRPLAGDGWKGLALALAVFFAVHVLGLVLYVKYFYAFALGAWSQAHYGPLARNVIGGLRYFFDIPITFALPLVAWVAAFPRRVLPMLKLEQVTAKR